VEAIVLSAEYPSVIDEVSRCLQVETSASNFALEADFTRQLKASLRK
jgi:hypothetical protein